MPRLQLLATFSGLMVLQGALEGPCETPSGSRGGVLVWFLAVLSGSRLQPMMMSRWARERLSFPTPWNVSSLTRQGDGHPSLPHASHAHAWTRSSY
jgi:hypothetical protein